MYPIKVFDKDLNYLAEVDAYLYLTWTRRYRKSHSFELGISRYAMHAEKFVAGNYVVYKRSEKYRAGKIEYRAIKQDENGKASEDWTIIGKCVGGIVFDNRNSVTNTKTGDGYDSVNTNVEAAMKHYVRVGCIEAEDPDRNVPELVIADNENRGASVLYQARFQTISTILEELSLAGGMGWEVYFDLKQKHFVFDVLEGRDLSPGNGVNPPVTFSPEFDNIEVNSYYENYQDSKNVAYVAGQGEAQDRVVKLVKNGNFSGMDRREIFIDARDLNTDDGLIQRGNERLGELGIVKMLEFQALQNGPFLYLRDYDLGDIVRNIYPGIAEMDARIIEVVEQVTKNGETIQLTTGKEVPDLIKLIQQELKNYNPEMRR